MKIDIETKEFLKAINDFRTASRKKTGSVLKQVGKLVVRDAMSLTPPNDKDTAFADKKGKIQWAKQKKIQWMTHTPSGFYTEEDCSYFALVLIPRDEIWWVPVAEVAGKKSICTNAEKDVLHQYRGNLNPLREWGTQGNTILNAGGQIGGQSKL